MDKLIQENRVWFGETGGNMPRLKRFLCDVQQGMTATTIWKYTEVGHNQEGRQELKNSLIIKAILMVQNLYV